MTSTIGTLRPKEIKAEHDQGHSDHDQEHMVWNGAGQIAAHERAGHGRRRHPEEEAPIDPAGADVGQGRDQCRDRRDPDICSGSGRWARGCQDDNRKADISQHEPDKPASEGGEKAPQAHGHEEQGVQALEYRS